MNAKPRSSPTKLISHLLQEDAELRDVVEEFVDQLPARLAELQQAYERLDWDNLTTLAHRLKGAGGSYGYPDLSELGAEMEQSFRTHHAETFGQWLQRLNDMIAAARAGLIS